jgi:hypothetical protein
MHLHEIGLLRLRRALGQILRNGHESLGSILLYAPGIAQPGNFQIDR